MNKTVAALVLILAAACSRSSGKPASAAAGSAEPPAAAPALREAKDLLADDEVVAGYAVYQAEMAPHTKTALEVVMAAYSRAGGDAKKLEQAAKDDPRIAEYNERNTAALARAGLTEYEARIVSSSIGSYLATVYVAQNASDAAARSKAAEEKLAAQYGAAALATVKKHQPQLLAGQEATMKAMMAK